MHAGRKGELLEGLLKCDERPFPGMVLHDAFLGSSYSLISLPPVVLLTISLLLPAAPDDTSSAGGDKLHSDDISSGDNHRVPYDDECKISLCRVQVINLMGSKMTGSRIGRPLYMNTFPLSLAFFSHHLRSQYTTSRLPKVFARSLAQ
jgi:hypothetical protein